MSLSLLITLALSACATKPKSMFPDAKCFDVPTEAVKIYRYYKQHSTNPRERYTEDCKKDEDRICSEYYIDNVEDWSNSPYSLKELNLLKNIQTKNKFYYCNGNSFK